MTEADTSKNLTENMIPCSSFFFSLVHENSSGGFSNVSTTFTLIAADFSHKRLGYFFITSPVTCRYFPRVGRLNMSKRDDVVMRI